MADPQYGPEFGSLGPPRGADPTGPGKSPGRMTVRTPDVTEDAFRRWVDPAISATDSQSKHGAIVGVSGKPHNGFKATCSPND